MWQVMTGFKRLDVTKPALLGKAKLEREISDGKNKIRHKFLGRKI